MESRDRIYGAAVKRRPFASSPAEFGTFIVEDTEKWSKVIRAAGIKVN